MKEVDIYTDGACSGNPGPGGYGAVLLYGSYRKELSGGFRLTTNNRMEILAAVMALETLKESCQVDLYSDSKYLVDAIEKGWMANWERKNWKRGDKDVPNRDMWLRLKPLLQKHKIKFIWVRGHADNVENERCDQLAREAGNRNGLPDDEGYMKKAAE